MKLNSEAALAWIFGLSAKYCQGQRTFDIIVTVDRGSNAGKNLYKTRTISKYEKLNSCIIDFRGSIYTSHKFSNKFWLNAVNLQLPFSLGAANFTCPFGIFSSFTKH